MVLDERSEELRGKREASLDDGALLGDPVEVGAEEAEEEWCVVEEASRTLPSVGAGFVVEVGTAEVVFALQALSLRATLLL